MTSGKRYVLVEGHGEVDAIGNLLSRMSQRIGDHVVWAKPHRWANLHQWESKRQGVLAGVEFVRAKADAASLLIVRDADDECPRETAPAMAARLRTLAAPFPVAFVLLKPEYEVLFLPCVDQMAGKTLDARPGLREGARWIDPHWESRRGVKEWLSQQFPRGRSYKPSVDQLLLTRMLDLDRIAAADVPCFGTLERAVAFLAQTSGSGVYP
jgi:hypothetical protein